MNQPLEIKQTKEKRAGAEMRATLEQFRDWLAEAIDEAGAIDEIEEEGRPGSGGAEDEKLGSERLGQFTEFVGHSADYNLPLSTEEITRLDESISLNGPETASEPEQPITFSLQNPGSADAPLPEVGLLQLIEAFTAMRHDLKLQTKSARGLEGVLQSAVAGLQEALACFSENPAREQEAAQRAAKPFVETLVALDEALLRGARAFDSMRARITQRSQSPPQSIPPLRPWSQADDEEPASRPPWWRRLLARGGSQPLERTDARTSEPMILEEFARLEEGFALIRSRVERALLEHAIVRIDCAGRRVDPSEMTVVELVDRPESEPETVAEELRPGYKWHGAVVRYAEVRAVGGRNNMDGRELAS